MGRALGFLGLLIVMAVGVYIYSKQAASVSPEGAPASPRATVDLVGVKNDLLAIANAERSHFALDGKYVSLDELRSSHELSMPAAGRGPYQYSTEVTSSGFRAVATYSGTPMPGLPQTLSVDETMQVKTE
jgi:hypothetical protein